ncbi:YhjD/YihY/BrkB family envelope integrity protein [Streptomyces sp. NPDC051909]|uniref:YhjD/YihY/BrkB family envelope integrity protein n=1 Tax=Streptomyces sp. NPDC051909 TaxID=3154944 RepID=UPI003431E1E5
MTTAQTRRERAVRTLTLWLRPAFVLRVVSRFQRAVGFDRAMSLASSALTALVSLAIVSSSVLSLFRHTDTAERIIKRYSLTGGGADAVTAVFSAPEDTSAGIVGSLLLIVSLLSFTRVVQRFFEQTWELKPLSVRNTLNGLLWIGVLAGYMAAAGWIRAAAGRAPLEVGASLLTAPLTAVFLIATGRLLSARRLTWRDLLPFAAAAAAAEAGFAVGATAYLPRYFSSSATRYGPVGAVFAMISALFVVMLVIVACGALGREVGVELDRIRRGERPPDNEVRQEWDIVLDQVRLRWNSRRTRPDRRQDDGTPGSS